MPHSSKDVRYVCECGYVIGPNGERLRKSEDRGGSRVKFQLCRECGDRWFAHHEKEAQEAHV